MSLNGPSAVYRSQRMTYLLDVVHGGSFAVMLESTVAAILIQGFH